MTQYHYETPTTALEPTKPPRPELDGAKKDQELRRLQDIVESQKATIEALQKEIRRIYRQLDAHARVINSISRRNG